MSASGYAAPRSLDEAVSLLSKSANAHVLAGGQGLLVGADRSRLAGALLVDLGRVPGLTGITGDAKSGLTIGAMTTLRAVAEDAGIARAFPALAEGARLTGDPQLQNRATIGGSLVGADPDSHIPAIALALDASLQVTGPKGKRTLRAEELVAGGAALQKGEVVTAITIPAAPAKTGVAYQVHRNPATFGPLCGVAASVTLGADGTIASARVALVGVADRVSRAAAVEKAVAGKKPSDAAAAAAGALDGLKARADVFASAEYRAHLARVLAARAISDASARAAG
jgi:carbon-monoxide dehydrogenase medium subunit